MKGFVLSDIKVIRDSIAAKLETAGIRVQPRFDGTVVPPVAIVLPPDRGTYIRYNTSSGSHDAFFSILLLVDPQSESAAQEELDKYCSPDGSKSIFTAVSGPLTDAHWCEVLEVRDCSPRTLRSADAIREYVGAEFVVSVGLF